MKIRRRDFSEKSVAGVGGLLLGTNLATGQIRAFPRRASAGQGDASSRDPLVTLRTQTAIFATNARGSWNEILANHDGRYYLAPHQPAPLLSVRLGQLLCAPTRAAWEAATGRLTLGYADADVTVVLRAEAKPTHVVFEVVEVRTWNSYYGDPIP